MDDASAPDPSPGTSVRELRRLVDAVLDHLEAQGVDEIVLSHDRYLRLDAADRRTVDRDPHGTVGRLSEDLDNLRSSVEADDVLGYGLVWLAEVFRTIGEDLPG